MSEEIEQIDCVIRRIKDGDRDDSLVWQCENLLMMLKGILLVMEGVSDG